VRLRKPAGWVSISVALGLVTDHADSSRRPLLLPWNVCDNPSHELLSRTKDSRRVARRSPLCVPSSASRRGNGGRSSSPPATSGGSLTAAILSLLEKHPDVFMLPHRLARLLACTDLSPLACARRDKGFRAGAFAMDITRRNCRSRSTATCRTTRRRASMIGCTLAASSSMTARRRWPSLSAIAA